MALSPNPFPDTLGAFVGHGRVELSLREDGPLAGLTFAVKDLFDVEGVATGAGSPEWLATHGLAGRTAPAVTALLEAGARVVGKTLTDEIAWSLTGKNAHYGTPINVAAPGRIPGGSSSGSAAACAAGLADFALGSDTGGSVRLPASFCGLYGLRPTHGRISLEGAVALAPSYDTAGWFARDAETFAKVGRVLLGAPAPQAAPTRLLIAADLFDRAEPAAHAALAPALERLSALFGEVERIEIGAEVGMPWREAFRLVQAAEAWQTHGDWVREVRPAFGPGVRERFAAAERLTLEEAAAARAGRERIRARMEEAVPLGSILALPTCPGIAPLAATPEPELDAFRAQAIELLCAAGHAGMPQLSLPAARVDGCPIGLSILAPRLQDETLIDVALRLGPL